MNSIIPLEDFVKETGGQSAAGRKLDCSQPTIKKAMERGDVFVQVENGKVTDAFSKKPFPDPKMHRKQKAPSGN